MAWDKIHTLGVHGGGRVEIYHEATVRLLTTSFATDWLTMPAGPKQLSLAVAGQDVHDPAGGQLSLQIRWPDENGGARQTLRFSDRDGAISVLSADQHLDSSTQSRGIFNVLNNNAFEAIPPMPLFPFRIRANYVETGGGTTPGTLNDIWLAVYSGAAASG